MTTLGEDGSLAFNDYTSAPWFNQVLLVAITFSGSLRWRVFVLALWFILSDWLRSTRMVHLWTWVAISFSVSLQIRIFASVF